MGSVAHEVELIPTDQDLMSDHTVHEIYVYIFIGICKI